MAPGLSAFHSKSLVIIEKLYASITLSLTVCWDACKDKNCLRRQKVLKVIFRFQAQEIIKGMSRAFAPKCCNYKTVRKETSRGRPLYRQIIVGRKPRSPEPFTEVPRKAIIFQVQKKVDAFIGLPIAERDVREEEDLRRLIERQNLR